MVEGRLGHQRLPGRRIKAMVRLGLETDIPLVLHPMSRELQALTQSWDPALSPALSDKRETKI